MCAHHLNMVLEQKKFVTKNNHSAFSKFLKFALVGTCIVVVIIITVVLLDFLFFVRILKRHNISELPPFYTDVAYKQCFGKGRYVNDHRYCCLESVRQMAKEKSTITVKPRETCPDGLERSYRLCLGSVEWCKSFNK